MSKLKWYEVKEAWNEFRSTQAKRFGLSLYWFDVLFKRYPDLMRRGRINHDLVDEQVLTGNPEIAAFMGISVKMLRVWLNKFPDLPIQRDQSINLAITDCLLCWNVRKKCHKLPKELKQAVLDNRNSPTDKKKNPGKKCYSPKEIEDALFLFQMSAVICNLRFRIIENLPLPPCTPPCSVFQAKQ